MFADFTELYSYGWIKMESKAVHKLGVGKCLEKGVSDSF
jgi:hypothetical protein